MPIAEDRCCCNFSYGIGSQKFQWQIQKLDTDANDRQQIWVRGHGATVHAVAVHPDGIVVGGERGFGNFTTRKYDADGVQLWAVDHGAAVYGIAVDSSGNVITTGVKTSGYTTRKYDTDGTLLWSSSYGNTSHGNKLFVDGSDDIFETGYNLDSADTDHMVRKVDGSNGSEIWFATDSSVFCQESYDVIADGSYVYCMMRGGLQKVAQIDLSGNLVSVNTSRDSVNEYGYGLAFDGSAVLLCTRTPSGVFVGGDYYVAKIYSASSNADSFDSLIPYTLASNSSTSTFFVAGEDAGGSSPFSSGNLYEFTPAGGGTYNWLNNWTRGDVINEIAVDAANDFIYAVGTTVTETWT